MYSFSFYLFVAASISPASAVPTLRIPEFLESVDQTPDLLLLQVFVVVLVATMVGILVAKSCIIMPYNAPYYARHISFVMAMSTLVSNERIPMLKGERCGIAIWPACVSSTLWFYYEMNHTRPHSKSRLPGHFIMFGGIWYGFDKIPGIDFLHPTLPAISVWCTIATWEWLTSAL